jgi:hypothetical protein
MFDFIWKPKQELINICEQDNEDQLIIVLNNMIINEKKDSNDAPKEDINKEKILNTIKNRWLTNYCIDNKKWKTLKVLINYRILVAGQIQEIEESIANNYDILTNEKINDLKNLLIAIKIYRNYNHEYVNPTTYSDDHPYIHLLYVGGFNNSRVLSFNLITELDTILVNNLIDKLFNLEYNGLYINVDINKIFNEKDKKYQITYDKLEYAFCNNIDDCIGLFNNIHSIDITKWKTKLIDIEKQIRNYYGNEKNRKKYYNLSKPIYYPEKFSLL